MPRGVAYNKLESIKQKLEGLAFENQKAILKILREDNVMFSENVNGIFFDIVGIELDTLKKIQSYLDFCEKSEEYLEGRRKTETECLNEYYQTVKGSQELLSGSKTDGDGMMDDLTEEVDDES